MLGIILVQLLWMRNAIRVSQARFDRSVSEALSRVAEKLERKESLVYLDQELELNIAQEAEAIPEPPAPEKQPLPPGRKLHISLSGDTIVWNDKQWQFIDLDIDTFLLEDFYFTRELEWLHEKDKSMRLVLDSMRRKHRNFIIPDNMYQDAVQSFLKLTMPPPPPPPPEPEVIRKKILSEHTETAKEIEVRVQQQEEKVLQKEVKKLNRKVRKMQDAVRQYVIEVETGNIKIEKRIDSVNLRQELDKALSDEGIILPYEYGIMDLEKDSLTPLHSLNFNTVLAASSYKHSLFPDDLFAKPGHLVVYFHGQRQHLYKSLSVLMGASLVFTLGLVLAFIATVITLLRQKKITEIKNDFINNMTHEFKTPIATISLAADSINNPKVLQDPEMIRSFTRIIREENDRMNTHVEQVLQMALIDNRDLQVDLQSLDVHELISRSVENILLQIEKKQGTVTFDFSAGMFEVMADEVHLFNALLNLLDNANKYSADSPRIRVSTRNHGNWIIIGVEDNGPGMSRETQKKIFDKFYRVPTGKLHNIKGFGLGLNYVKAITDAHHGKIAVHSEPGKGSLFEIWLPLT